MWSPGKRIEVRAGEISKGVTEKNWQIIEATENLLRELGPDRSCNSTVFFRRRSTPVY